MAGNLLGWRTCFSLGKKAGRLLVGTHNLFANAVISQGHTTHTSCLLTSRQCVTCPVVVAFCFTEPVTRKKWPNGWIWAVVGLSVLVISSHASNALPCSLCTVAGTWGVGGLVLLYSSLFSHPITWFYFFFKKQTDRESHEVSVQVCWYSQETGWGMKSILCISLQTESWWTLELGLLTFGVCVCLLACMYHEVHIQIRAHLAGVNSLLPLCGFQGSNSGSQVWHQAHLPAEPSC